MKMKMTRLLFRGSVLLLLLALIGCATSESRQKMENDASAHYKLGIAQLEENHIQDAFVEFQKSIEIDPKDAETHYALGHVYYLQENYEKAIQEFKTVLKLDPEHSEAHNHLGKVYEIEQRWDDAIQEYQEALKNPTYPTPQFAHYNLGLVYEKKERFSDAIKEFQEALRIDPNFVTPVGGPSAYIVYYEIGQTLSKLQRPAEAIEAYKEALKLFPDYAAAHFGLGLVYFKQGSKQLAKEEFEKVLKFSQDGTVLAKNAKEYLESLK
jgi:type IV pilus biogenesis/stability protein PilW